MGAFPLVVYRMAVCPWEECQKAVFPRVVFPWAVFRTGAFLLAVNPKAALLLWS